MVVTSVRALGREGIWRLQNYDFESSHENVKAKIKGAPFLLQPEEGEKYALIQFEIGTFNTTIVFVLPSL